VADIKNKIIISIVILPLFSSCLLTTVMEQRHDPYSDVRIEEETRIDRRDDESRSAALESENLISIDDSEDTIETQETAPEMPRRYSLTMAAAGDNLFHITLINSSLVNGEYNFFPIYSRVREIIRGADIAFINQETVMAGESFGHSGYPNFNSPQSLAPVLSDTGFDVINIANNHTMDMGRAGILATLDYLDTFEEFTVIGARKEGESARLITQNNITFGFLSYTYGLNGYSVPRDNPNLISLINREKMTQEINALRSLCDFLIVSMHWGAEYLPEPDRSQTDLAMFLAELNVDLVIGHHPHVLQRAETIVLEDGRKTLVFYSIGNFVSHQSEKERVIGAIAVITFTLEESPQPRAEISDYGIIPVVTHYETNFTNTRIYPLYEYTDELLSLHRIRINDRTLTMDYINTVIERVNAKIIMNNPFSNDDNN